MFKRKLEVGDSIICKGEKAEIGEILFQDAYVEDWVDEDRKYIDIEFKDTKGKYRHWKSHLDGGKIMYKDSFKVKYGKGLTIDFNGVKGKLTEQCSADLERVAIGMARNASGDWRNNQFNMRIYEDNGVIKTSAYGLGKVYRKNEILLEDILDENNRESYDFYKALYNLIKGLNEEGIVADEISFDFIPGRKAIVGDLMDSTGSFYRKNKIENLKAEVWE